MAPWIFFVAGPFLVVVAGILFSTGDLLRIGLGVLALGGAVGAVTYGWTRYQRTGRFWRE